MRDAVAKDLCRMKTVGIIKKIDASPCVSNLVIAEKKDCNIRLYVRLDNVNKTINPSSYPLPKFEKMPANCIILSIFQNETYFGVTC